MITSGQLIFLKQALEYGETLSSTKGFWENISKSRAFTAAVRYLLLFSILILSYSKILTASASVNCRRQWFMEL